MRISGFHVDGYGLLRDLEVRGLGPGTTVVHGPNEAGKSTLHAFLVRIMFGHPARNDAKRRPRYMPLRGGKHGGMIGALDDEGGRWEIHRYTDGTPRLRVVTPDGTESTTDDTLAGLLGRGMDEDRYEQVFAINLDDLADLGELQGRALDDLLLDATTVGAGRSLRQAISNLDERRDAIWTPRSRELPLDRFRRELRDAQRQLRDAQERAASYHQALEDVARIRATLDEVRQAQQQAQVAIARQERLLTAWEAWQDVQSAGEQLATLTDRELPDVFGAIMHRVERHAADLPRQAERRSQLIQATSTADAARADADGALQRLPAGWDEERVLATPTDPTLAETVDRAVTDLRDARRDLGHADQAVEAARTQFNQAQTQATRRRDAVGPRPAEDLEARQAALSGLNRVLPRLDASPAPSAAGPVGPPRWVPVVAVILALVLVASSLTAFTTNLVGLGVSTMIGALLAAGVAVGTLRMGTGAPVATGDEPATLVTDLQQQAVDAGRTLGLSPPITWEKVAAAEQEIQAFDDERRGWEERLADAERAERDAQQAEEALTRATQTRDRSVEVVEAAMTTWQTAAEAAGLDPDMDPAGAASLLATISEARRNLDAASRAATGRDGVAEQVQAFDAITAELCATVGRDVGDDPDTALAELQADCAAEAAERARHDDDVRQATERRATAERALRVQLGDGPDAHELRAELETGRVTAWQDQLQELKATKADLDTRRDQVAGDLRAAEDDLAARGQEDAVVTAASRVEQLTAQCQQLAEEWATIDVASGLLSTTLTRFEDAHQPGVLQEAGTLLARATGGRWIGVRRIDDELYVTADGDDRVPAHALSRGATEQLYLCLRLALAEELNQHGARLPLLIDDLMANADPERADGLARILADVATRQQVIVFTCNPATADRVVAADPGAGVLAMQPAGAGTSWQREPGGGTARPTRDTDRRGGSDQLELDGTDS